MSFATTWMELEASAGPGAERLRRRVHGETEVDLFLELLNPGAVRAISLEVDDRVAPEASRLPQARGIDHRVEPVSGGRARLVLALVDPAAGDIYATLAEDVAAATAAAADDRDAVGAWTGRMSRWKRLLQNSPYGLTPSQQRGLFAELTVLVDHLEPATGIVGAVGGWEGPIGAGHDVQLSGGSLEVKSCAANEPQIVTINGERQLEVVGTDSLHLIHVSLDIHRPGRETLPQIVARARAAAERGGAGADLEERLFSYGYLDSHAVRYGGIGYETREIRAFEIREGFPRLVEADLPEGVGGLRYRLAIAACAAFEVDVADAIRVAVA